MANVVQSGESECAVWSARVLPVALLVAGGVGHMEEGWMLDHSPGDA